MIRKMIPKWHKGPCQQCGDYFLYTRNKEIEDTGQEFFCKECQVWRYTEKETEKRFEEYRIKITLLENRIKELEKEVEDIKLERFWSYLK